MTVRENLLPAAMVPGLVTIKDKDGKQQNVYPVDAKELINSGEYELVDNGAIEAARLAATPLRSGMASGIPDNLVVAEVSGIEGRLVIAADEKERDAIRDKAENADAVPAKTEAADAHDKPKAADKGESKPPASGSGSGSGGASGSGASDKK